MLPVILKVLLVYKGVSIESVFGVRSMKAKKSVQSWLKRALDDPIVKILSQNSLLTKIQVETLLIDVLSDRISGKTLIYEEKSQLRITRPKVSRGAFNRTLAQAKRNMVRAIYTLILLGYLGLSESTTLDPYLEIANKLNNYMEAHKKISDKNAQPEEQLKVIKLLREELVNSLEGLSTP